MADAYRFRVSTNDLAAIYTDFNPAMKNLYTVEIYDANSMSVSPGIRSSQVDSMNDYLKYHATKIEFGGEALDLERDSVTHKFKLKKDNSFQWVDELKITWQESDDWKVKKYHENWLSNFYDKDTGCYKSQGYGTVFDDDTNSTTVVSAASSLYRIFKIILPIPATNRSTELKFPCIRFNNVLPKNVGDLSLEWTNNPSLISHSLSYYVESWSWEEGG
jgi:hypothetical protein